MFNLLPLLALVAPLVSALTIETPSNVTSGGSITVKWTTASDDPPTWSLELKNQVFNSHFAIANNVVPEMNQLTLTLPVVPVGDGYTLEAVDIGDINKVIGKTGTFSIGASTATSTSASGTGTGTGSSTSPATVPTTTRPATTSSSFGSTISSSGSSTGSGTGTGTATGAPAATSSNAAMAPLKMNSNVGAVAAVLFSAVAGAAIVAL